MSVIMSQSKLDSQKHGKELNNELKGLLKLFIGDLTQAYCLYCKADFYVKISVIKTSSQKHAKRAKHDNSSTKTIQQLVVFKTQYLVNLTYI